MYTMYNPPNENCENDDQTLDTIMGFLASNWPPEAGVHVSALVLLKP